MLNLSNVKQIKNYIILFISITGLLFFIACGGDSNKGNDENVTTNKNESGLSDWELENGFGPVKKKLNLGPINEEMSAKGEKIFETKCGTCHKLDERYVGPAQRNVLQRVTPEFFINMVLNPEENIKKHPHAKEMLGKYMQTMTNQNINLKDALTVLEYFRVLDKELKQNQQSQ